MLENSQLDQLSHLFIFFSGYLGHAESFSATPHILKQLEYIFFGKFYFKKFCSILLEIVYFSCLNLFFYHLILPDIIPEEKYKEHERLKNENKCGGKKENQ